MSGLNKMLRRDETNLVFRMLERAVDIVIWPPDARHAMLVVPEPLLEMYAKLAEDRGVRHLLVNLGAESQPCPFTESCQCMCVFFVGAVKAWMTIAVSIDSRMAKMKVALFALAKYVDSALSSVFLKTDRMLSHICGAAAPRCRSTGSEICFLKFRCTHSSFH
jgi:hypothetical protein